MIRAVSPGRFAVFSKTGKRLSKPGSRKAAVKRLRAIEHFKHKKG